MAQESIEEIMERVNKLLKSCEEFDKELNVQKEDIEFLINEWKTNKRYFATNDDDCHEVNVEDVIKSVYYFAWGARGNFDHTQEDNLKKVQEFSDYLERKERLYEDNDDEKSASVVEDIAVVFGDIFNS